jgi:hypothetical protein
MTAAAFGVLLSLALGGAAPETAPGGRVALVRVEGQGDDGLQTRLSAELRAQRFDVVELARPRDGAAPERLLSDALHDAHADAAVLVEPTPAVIRVWIANGLTGKQIFREVALEEHAVPDRALVALWTVELLRASAIAPRAPAPVVAAPAPPPPPPAPAGIALAVAPAATVSPGGLGTSWHVALGARWQRWRGGGLEALALVPMLPARIAHQGGAAIVSLGLLGVGAFAATGGRDARWSAQAALGAALLLTRATGDTTDVYEGSTETAASGGPYARAGASLRATEWFRARVDAVSGVMFPRPVVEFDGTRVASWGRPWLALLVGGEATF